MAMKKIPLRYSAVCTICGIDLPPRTFAWWDTVSKSTTCVVCVSNTGLVTGDPFAPPPMATSKAGSSAFDQYRMRANPPDSRLLHAASIAVSPRTTTAWLKGARGEQAVANRLDSLPRTIAIHDRRVPGTKANIDHIAVTPSGVWVIDTKYYSGKLEKRLTSSGWSLFVAGRNRDRLASGVIKQVAVVEAACSSVAVVKGALCFYDVTASLLFRPFRVKGVAVHTLRTLTKSLSAAGPLDDKVRFRIASQLDAALRPASNS